MLGHGPRSFNPRALRQVLQRLRVDVAPPIRDFRTYRQYWTKTGATQGYQARRDFFVSIGARVAGSNKPRSDVNSLAVGMAVQPPKGEIRLRAGRLPDGRLHGRGLRRALFHRAHRGGDSRATSPWTHRPEHPRAIRDIPLSDAARHLSSNRLCH